MSARDELHDHLVSGVNWGADELIDTYRDQVAIETQKTDAATVRKTKVREPVDEAERYLNAVLEDVALRIEGGRG